MDVVGFIFQLFFGTAISSVRYFTTWWDHATAAGFHPSVGSMIFTTIVVSLFLGSGFVAMTIAELNFRSRPLHFALGVVLPIAYPIFIHTSMTKAVPDSDDDEEEEEEEEAQPAAVADKEELPDSALKTFKKAQEEDYNGIYHGPFEQRFFEYMSRDEQGNQKGPFILELVDDGRILEISAISAAFSNAVALITGDDNNSRTIRLPYSKIKSFCTKKAWLEEAGMDLDE